MEKPIWTIRRGQGPIVATALHDGHEVRDEALRLMALAENDRLREEDPFTGRLAEVAPTRVVGLRSRFEVDLNRAREGAVYRRPEDAWGLQVWKGELPEVIAERSLANYDAFYAELEGLYRELAEKHGRFLVLDLHSYNHRRTGAGGPPANGLENPQVNIGTGTMPDRVQWARVIDRFMEELAGFDFPGGRLDVRENVKFRGRYLASFVHEHFPEKGCAIAIEVKKFYMDEWTGQADTRQIIALREVFRRGARAILTVLSQVA